METVETIQTTYAVTIFVPIVDGEAHPIGESDMSEAIMSKSIELGEQLDTVISERMT